MGKYVEYRGNKHVDVVVLGKEMHNGRLMVKVKTKKAVGKRPKGSIDWRSPDKVYG